jgi:hypothetical protein
MPVPYQRRRKSDHASCNAAVGQKSIPVNSFSATTSICTSVIVPSAIEIGIPVSIIAISSTKMITTRGPRELVDAA